MKIKRRLIDIIKKLVSHGSISTPDNQCETVQFIFSYLSLSCQKEIEESSGLPKDLAHLTAKHHFTDLKSEKPENQQ